ncbi:DNA translocase FtsK [Dermatobacter hominis]|uniref:DNA translocase FtsK n=1 Tax=Dermatobacter hominis TaxID=2884263 RepID=UPI001D10F4D7|nr:DNA translocase FtsK [Dermatobacter hominis]UDY36828.1 DNA translocase FtsK [Dermatobacter hominis]
MTGTVASKQKTTPRRSGDTTRRSSGTSRSSSGGSRSSAARRSTSRSSSRSRSTSGRSRAATAERTTPGLGVLLDGHGHDIAGLVLVLFGVVAAIGIYAGAAGPLGSGVASLAAGLLGRLDVLLPPALVAGGVLVIVGPRRTDVDLTADHLDVAPDEYDEGALDPHERHVARLRRLVGGVLGTLTLLGLLDVALGQDRSIEPDGLDAYAEAGGLVGAGVAGVFERLVGRWGALAVLVVLALLSASLLSGRSLRTVGHDVGRGVGPLWRALTSWLSDLFRVGPPADDDGEADEAEHTAVLYDQDVDAPAKPKRTRSKKTATPSVVVADTEVDPTQLEIELPPGVAGSAWKLPSVKLLSLSGRRDVDTKAVEARAQVLVSALAEHGVQTRIVGMTVGPTVTRYELELGTGVKVARVTSLHKDIAYAMASPDVRILAPIPGRQAIGVEVPNADRVVVNLGDILTSEEARRATHPLQVAVGRDINGIAKLMNLATMPHLLIAGQTGAGKSSCINSIITSVMMRATPEQVRMILIDPKRVELTQYNRIPHLLTQVVANPKKAANALNWAVKEMERRYDLLSEVGVRDITGYNAKFDKGELQAEPGEERTYERLPFILIVVDELADLMMVAPRDVEESICRIAQMARAVGLHLVIATQRPSVNVITGVIKANVPARLAFAVASATDSKVILDQGGAERLVGRGDMLLLEGGSSAPERIQGAWVEESEVQSIVSSWRRQAPDVESQYVSDVQGSEDSGGPGGGGTTGGDDDELLTQAMELVVRSQLGSTSMLQRKLKVGFARAGRLMDLLEERGVVGPSEGSKARDVLMTPEELDNMIESGAL